MDLYPSAARLPKAPPRERLVEDLPKGWVRASVAERRRFQTAFGKPTKEPRR